MNQKISFLNSSLDVSKIFLEPWGEEKILQPDSKVIINFEDIDREDAQIEIECTKDGIVVYCPTGSKADFL